MKWFVIIGSLFFIAVPIVVILLERRDRKRNQIYHVTIENGKVEPFKNHF